MSVEGTGMANSEDITRFTAVDYTQEPEFFRRFLDEGNKNPDIVSSKPIILSGLRLTGGERVEARASEVALQTTARAKSPVTISQPREVPPMLKRAALLAAFAAPVPAVAQ